MMFVRIDHIELPVKACDRKRAAQPKPRIVDENLDILAPRAAIEHFTLLGIRKIGLNNPALDRQLTRQLFQTVPAACHQNQVISPLCELARNLLANAGRRACNDSLHFLCSSFRAAQFCVHPLHEPQPPPSRFLRRMTSQANRASAPTTPSTI